MICYDEGGNKALTDIDPAKSYSEINLYDRKNLFSRLISSKYDIFLY